MNSMLLHSYPNSEIEVSFSSRSIAPRIDSGRVRPSLTYGSLLRQNPIPSLKAKQIKGWGFLHQGVGSPRRGTRKKICRLGGAIDRVAEERGWVRCFLTLTCPGSSESAVKGFSAWSGKILHSLHNWIGKKLKRYSKDCPIARVHVWELQKRGAEHLHAVYVVPEEIFFQIEKEVRSWFHNLLKRISVEGGVDLFERGNGRGSWGDNPGVLQVKVEKVVKAVGSYLGKYLGKNTHTQFKGFSCLRVPRPARLWGASLWLKNYLRYSTQSQFFDLPQTGRCLFLCAVQELAIKRGVPLYLERWAGGLAFRLRLFFSGNKSAEQSFHDELVALAVSFGKRECRRTFCMPVTETLTRKAFRIQNDGKKRSNFGRLYGDDCSKALANWVNDVSQSRFQYELLLMCLRDYDEVLNKSLGLLKPGQGGSKTTFQQLSILLFT